MKLELKKQRIVTHEPHGHLIALIKEERLGDLSNAVFSNWGIKNNGGKAYKYYASSDSRMHIATSNLDQLVDYCVNSPTD